jgi:peptidoglycan/LPS O-acetylase OafA/YrhL
MVALTAGCARRFCADAARADVLIAVLLGLALAGGTVWPGTFARAFLPYKAHFFALGVASAGLMRGNGTAPVRYGLVLAMTLALCRTADNPGKLLPPLVWTACLAVQHRPDWLPSLSALLGSARARFLGASSYCIYLTNAPVQKLCAFLLASVAGNDAVLFTAIWLPAAIGLPVLLSVWLHTRLELPAQNAGRRIAQRLAR